MVSTVFGPFVGEISIGAAGPDSASQANDAGQTLNDGFSDRAHHDLYIFVTAV